MLDLPGAMDGLKKVRANLTKQAKTISADKAKADAVKRVDALMGNLEKVLATKKGLDKRLEEMKKLASDMGTYNSALDKVTAEARALSRIAGDSAKASDTPTRDFFMLANLLQRVGQEMHMEPP